MMMYWPPVGMIVTVLASKIVDFADFVCMVVIGMMIDNFVDMDLFEDIWLDHCIVVDYTAGNTVVDIDFGSWTVVDKGSTEVVVDKN